jgi:hypothetical protein
MDTFTNRLEVVNKLIERAVQVGDNSALMPPESDSPCCLAANNQQDDISALRLGNRERVGWNAVTELFCDCACFPQTQDPINPNVIGVRAMRIGLERRSIWSRAEEAHIIRWKRYSQDTLAFSSGERLLFVRGIYREFNVRHFFDLIMAAPPV